MFVTNHVLAGTLVASACRRRPVLAFAVGVASHVAMDLTPHWGDGPDREPDAERFYRVARRDGLLAIATAATVLTFGLPPRRALVCGIAGAALLDADKPVEHFFAVRAFPRAVNRFHQWIQNESPAGIVNELVAGVVLAAAVARVLQRERAGRRAQNRWAQNRRALGAT
jgi:hypothetical protein